ncbi:hypothetical protein [Nocardia farcinica]|nr:hypothetical protein [Nocardia farcinica]
MATSVVAASDNPAAASTGGRHRHATCTAARNQYHNHTPHAVG